MSVAKAYAQTKAEMQQTEVYINERIAIPKKGAIWDAFTGKTSTETSGSKSSDCPHRWLAAADASDFFAKEQVRGVSISVR